MDMRYIKHKGPKVDRCSICGEMKALTWDHVPPKAVLANPDTYASTLFWDEGMPSAQHHMRHYQSGIKYRTVCAECNNVLIGKNDEAYKEFHSAVVERLRIASLGVRQGLVMPSSITVHTRINRVLRAICGHFLAMKQGYDDEATVDGCLRAYLQDETMKMDGIYVFSWFYPYPSVVNARDFSVHGTSAHTHPKGFVSVMASNPLAFMVSTDNETDCQVDGLAGYATTAIDDVVPVTLHLASAMYAGERDLKHFVWPANISDDANGALFALGSDEFMEGSRLGVPR